MKENGIIFFRKSDDTHFVFDVKNMDQKRKNKDDQLRRFVNPLMLQPFFKFNEEEHKAIIFDTP